jgi:hypothetical protein
MRNFPFGGQTKIAYTQDPNLDALEVTDHDKRGLSTARFFNGSKTEYPRRMHCLQGSDAHRLVFDPKNTKRLGIGDRPTEILLDAPSFEGLKTVLQSTQFDRTRPARPQDKPFDPLESAREEGPNIVLSFHESASQRGGKLTGVLADICAFANTAGGTLFVGASPRKEKPKGLAVPKEVEDEIRKALEERFSPPLEIKSEVIQSQGAQVLSLRVPKGTDRPYCLDDNKFYVRDEAETSLAVRDEIVALVREVLNETNTANRLARDGGRGERSSGGQRDQRNERGRGGPPADQNGKTSEAKAPTEAGAAMTDSAGSTDDAFYLPQIGVEIVQTDERNGIRFYSIRDLRNGHVIKNVTRRGARRLWNYAIGQQEDHPIVPDKVEWKGNVGLINVDKRAGKVRYDLARREGNLLRVFYGVTDDGMEGEWAAFVQDE